MIGLLGDAFARALAWLTTAPQKTEPTPEDRLILAGRAVADWLEATWRRDIIDPPIGSKHPRAAESLEVINDIIKANGWTWVLPYKGNGQPQWCGMTMGKAWAEAGLDPSWLSSYFASTDRLAEWLQYRRWEASKPNPKPTGTGRRLYIDLTKPFSIVPRAGDIVIVGNGKRKAGDHVTGLIEATLVNGAWTFDTISGNGGGLGPRGDSREGVSRKTYKVGVASGHYYPMWLGRPAAGDLVR